MASLLRCVLVSGLFLVMLNFVTSESNPCTNYKSINEPARSPKHILNTAKGEKAICDNELAPGWYRFTNAIQAQIPTTKPGIHHCGTFAPIWIQGTHPGTKEEEVKVVACANINNRMKGCRYRSHIRIKNCGNYYVYYLLPATGRCMAYCAEAKQEQRQAENRSKRKQRSLSTQNCESNNNTCLINGNCYNANETNPQDWCLQCSPGDQGTAWTPRQDNYPPLFSKEQSNRYGVIGESLSLQLKATDPENRNVTYSLINTTATSGYALSSAGLLMVNVTNKHSEFTVKVADECNAFDIITVKVNYMVCPCKNGGQCHAVPKIPQGSGHYDCRCPVGYTGTKCEVDIDECERVDCGNGTCIDGIGSYTCQCDVGFAGSLCDQKIYNCTNQSCFAGVQCTETVSGISCGPCPAGMTGDGKYCSEAPTTTASPTTFAMTTTEIPTTTANPTTTTAPTTTAPTTAAPTTTQAQTTAALPTTAPMPTTSTTTVVVTDCTTRDSTTAENVVTTTAEMPTTTQTKQTTDYPETTTASLEPLTKQTPRARKPYVVRAEIKIKIAWNEDYSDNEKDAFRNLTNLLAEKISQAYNEAGHKQFYNVTVMTFTQGSVIAEFELVFLNKTSDPLRPLRLAIKNGTLYGLQVDPDTLSTTVETTDTKAKTEPKDKDGNIVLIVILVIIAALIIVMVAVACYIRNRKKRKMDVNKRQPDDGAPAETIPLTEKNSK